MKHTIFSLLLLITISGYSQNNSILKAGVSYNEYMVGRLGYSEQRLNSKPGFFIEKPINFQMLNNTFSVTPGIHYFSTEEKIYFARSSGSFNREVNHKSLSGYTKILINFQPQKSEFDRYLGVLIGMRIYNYSKGSETGKHYNQLQYGHYSKLIEHENENNFFNRYYGGIVLGIQYKAKVINLFNPGMEIKYLPFCGQIEKGSVKEFSVFEVLLTFGFGTKKAAQN